MREAIRVAAAEGRTAPEIVELAAAGGLSGLRSFDVSESTVRELAGEVRDPAAAGTTQSPAPVDVIATAPKPSSSRRWPGSSRRPITD
jgi:hypothetical protein